MKLTRGLSPLLLSAGFLGLLASCAPARAPGAVQAAQATRYVCAPCGSPCDGATYDHPGNCPACGMPLVAQGSQEAKASHGKPVAVLLFDGAEIIDFTGPWEVFGEAGYDVYGVAASREPVTTSMGMKIVPQYTFADAPPAVVIVVPGGSVQGPRQNGATVKWVTEASARSDQTLSVCNGAFILGSAGLLDGLGATTTAHLIPKLRAEFPTTNVVSDRRFVDNGKIITAAGLSAGIDGALHVLEKLNGRGVAQQVALHLEYDWHPEGTFVRAALADRWIPSVDFDAIGSWSIGKTEGTTERWEMVVHVTSSKSTGELASYVARALAGAKWRPGATSGTSSDWSFADDAGRAWTGQLAIDPPSSGKLEYVVRVKIARTG